MATVILVAVITLFLGHVIFGHFEEHTPLWRKMMKWVLYLALGPALFFWDPRWAWAWVFGGLGAGLVFHFWWCVEHGINPWSAEPRELYYKLRGWPWKDR